jgi:hypothetical protein
MISVMDSDGMKGGGVEDHGMDGERRKGRQGGRGIDFPLRILVSSEMVGAIIGRGGATIRNITQESRARVDVHRYTENLLCKKEIQIILLPTNFLSIILESNELIVRLKIIYYSVMYG